MKNPFLLIYIVALLLGCKKETSCESCKTENKPPVAIAGADQTITLPINMTELDGSSSSDPDNNIISYSWTKIAGPNAFVIAQANKVQTQITGLTEGKYFFELQVTDSGSLASKDTMQVIVLTAAPAVPATPPTPLCDSSVRPQVNAQLITIGTLSIARGGVAVATAGNKIVFAGGWEGTLSGSYQSSRIDIYDLTTQTWSTSNLSRARGSISTIVNGNKIFFAGGGYYYDEYYSNIDIYDAITNTWSVAHFNEPRMGVAAAAIGNKVMFAGGYKENADFPDNIINTVDIYDLSTNIWSATNLSEARGFISAVTANDKIYFAGGSASNLGSNIIDIYENSTNTWSTSTLKYLSGEINGVFLNNVIYWAGSGCTVEIKDFNSGTNTSALLSRPDVQYSVVKDGKVILLRYTNSSNTIEVYNPATNIWSIALLTQSLPGGAAIISVNNTIYVAGGSIDCKPTSQTSCAPVYTNQVYKLEF